MPVFENKVRKLAAVGKLYPEDLVVVPVDRAEGLIYNQTISINKVPTLTTHNAYLMVLSVGCVLNNTPDHLRRFFRKLRNTERLALQGFPTTVALHLTRPMAMKAAGNAYPVPLILATLWPMLRILALSDLDLLAWPPCESLQRSVFLDSISNTLDVCNLFIKELSARGLVVDKKKAATARARAQAVKARAARRRRGSESE